MGVIKTNVSGLDLVERGYGQVELNHMSFLKTGQMYAQLPAKANINVLQQGQFVKYDYANNEVNFTGAGEWMMVFNEEKLYEDRETLSDYAMIRANYASGFMIPRVVKVNVGDIWTTNTIAEAKADLSVGNTLIIGNDGFLKKAAANSTGPFEIVKIYTMPDGQTGVKVMRIS